MAIVITNPETGKRHVMDKAALSELREAIALAEKAGRDAIVFRAMELDVETAKSVVKEKS